MHWRNTALLVALSSFAFASPAAQGVATSPASSGNKLPTPDNCKRLNIDADWPADNVWKEALKGIEPIKATRGFKRPDYQFEVTTVEQVQKAVKFAADNNVRLSIINSGHDFTGRNDAPSGLLINLNAMKGIRVLGSFLPTNFGAESVTAKTVSEPIKPQKGVQAAVTIGAGINIDELNKELRKSGLYTVGAAHGEVSVAGGWSQAGGHAALSTVFGLGVDQVLEYKVVTADGKLRIANRVTNQDLFWALRGGGGGFGVVVEATVKAYPAPTILSYSFFLNTTDYDDHKSIFPAAAYMCSQLPRLNQEAGMQGYFYVHQNALTGNFMAANEHANATRMTELWNPIIEKMVQMSGISRSTLLKNPPADIASSSMGSLQGKDGGSAGIPGSAGGHAGMSGMSMKVRRHGPGQQTTMTTGIIDMDSRLLGQAELTHPKLAEALEKAIPKSYNGQLRSHFTAGGKVLKPTEDTSVLPAWRKAYVHMIVATSEGTPSAQPLRDISPGMGAYVNEAWIKNPNWKNDFWGVNYPKLSAIKSKWDPNMLFYLTPGINADKMVAKNGRLCKVQGPQVEADPKAPAPTGDNQNIGQHEKPRTTWPLLYQGKGLPPKSVGLPKLPLGPKGSIAPPPKAGA